eukprot:GHRQ01020996.1.p1 GENE.GHRQ01020996.1~~GHRQ01020996.1.p1  ORF type:complete len:105 (-),score=11.80 GHRQ01020996.1:432-746(-)
MEAACRKCQRSTAQLLVATCRNQQHCTPQHLVAAYRTWQHCTPRLPANDATGLLLLYPAETFQPTVCAMLLHAQRSTTILKLWQLLHELLRTLRLSGHGVDAYL